MPRTARSTKRLKNRLRLFAEISRRRGLFDDNDTFGPEHIGKWAVVHERWPEFAQWVIRNRKASLTEFEDASKTELRFKKKLRGLPVFPDVDDLRELLSRHPYLGPFQSQLVAFLPHED